jgi:3' terminal RNA ribose 2'-O-methyltransferase Hen1
MLLTITTTHPPATDLGYLLHKHPARCQSFTLAFGQAHVFYPEALPERCTAALLLDIDPVGLVRKQRGPDDTALAQYVNDRPYVASSFLSVAIAQVFGSALAGKCAARPELVAQPLPLHARLAVLPCRGGEGMLRRLFEPLGYTVTAQSHVLDPHFPAWGASAYFTVDLRAETCLSELLAHLYVLVPVLDDDKHYWIDEAEVDKLLRHGGVWLAGHPERELIVQRYLRHQPRFTRQALARLLDDETLDPDHTAATQALEEAAVEERLSLQQQRLGAIVAALKSCDARRVLDLGCGDGKLLQALLADPYFTAIVGVDVSQHALEVARRRLHLDCLPARQQGRLTLWQGSLLYRDQRLSGYDAAVMAEVIEHLDPPRLAACERVVFADAQPTSVILTTPNVEYNPRFTALPTGAFRHRDHRFEWSRAEFAAWAHAVAERYGYTVRLLPVGPEDPSVGAPTQLGLFRRLPAPTT